MASMILLCFSSLSRFLHDSLNSNTYCTLVIQQQGEQLYQSGKYQKAYRLFVGLQELQRHHQHDQQHSVYYQIKCLIHLGKLHQALNVCYTIVKTYPSPKWYLLAADIYMQDGRLDLALKAVQKTQLHYGDDAWNDLILQERILYEGQLHQHQRQQQQHTTTWLNMVEVLPYDIVCAIFMLLPLKSLIHCSQVSHAWRSLIFTNPLFWQHLNFGINRLCSLSTITIQRYLSRLDGVPLLSLLVYNEQNALALLKCLCQSNCSQLSELDWISFQGAPKECWPLFRQVIISAGKTLTKLRLGSGWFKLNDMIDLVSATICPCLTTLDLYNCFASQTPWNDDDDEDDMNGHFPASYGITLQLLSLRHLGLSGVYGLTALHLTTILQRCPYLIELTLCNCLIDIGQLAPVLRHTCPQLEQFMYHQDWPRLDHTPTSSNRLQQHRTTYSQRLHPNSRFLTTDKAQYANWKQFTLRQTRTLTDDLLHTILSGSYYTLQTLDLKDNPRLTDHCILHMVNQQPDAMAAALPNLEECSFANCVNITQMGLCSVLKQAPRLRQLDVSGLSGVTDAVLLTMALSCPHLSILRLAHCRSITDHGIRCFIDTFTKSPTPMGKRKQDQWLQELDLTDTNLSMECLAYVMCYIRRDGI